MTRDLQLRDAKTMDLADVIVYVHDSSDTNSFSYISNLRVSFAKAKLCMQRVNNSFSNNTV